MASSRIPTHPGAVSRRNVTKLLSLSALSAMTGCCSIRGFPGDDIPAETPKEAMPLLLQSGKPLTLGAKPELIDAHAHFFNASDVTVGGYLAGPIASELPAALADLVRALVPFADFLAQVSPTAREEWDQLHGLMKRSAQLAPKDVGALLDKQLDDDRANTSRLFYEKVSGSHFEDLYNRLAEKEAQELKSLGINSFAPTLNFESLNNAMREGSRPSRALTPMLTPQLRTKLGVIDHPNGILAFVGYMLSSRWGKLRDYQAAFTNEEGSFGIDLTIGALVDFDRWLDCPPRSSQDDQIKLHGLISRLSGRYMRPLVAYNPWSDIKEKGAALQRVKDAIKTGDFIGAKIYPPNGFRPYGNQEPPTPPYHGPTPKELDEQLAIFWDTCKDLDIPVLAHTHRSMGNDLAHDDLAGPQGWQALMKRYASHKAPSVQLGHFGGDCDTSDWTEQMAQLMASDSGSTVFADIAYWSNFMPESAAAGCGSAAGHLEQALQQKNVKTRVMYGSDWFMMARERDWWRYPFDVAQMTKPLIDQHDLFAGNALRCYGARLL
jgi:predicted TIM-barrel fold metal-dependent hydrolase